MKQTCTAAVILSLGAMGAQGFMVTPPSQVGARAAARTRSTTATSPLKMSQADRAVDKAASSVKEGADSAKQTAKGLQHDSASSVKEGVDSAKQTAKGLQHDSADRASTLGDEVKSQAKDIKNKADQAGSNLQQDAKSSADKAAQSVEGGVKELAKDVKDIGKEAQNFVKGTADEVKRDASNAADQASATASSGQPNTSVGGSSGGQSDEDKWPQRKRTVTVDGATIDAQGAVIHKEPDSTLNRGPVNEKKTPELDAKAGMPPKEPAGKAEEKSKSGDTQVGVPGVPQGAKDAVGKATDAVAGAASKARVPPTETVKQS